MFEILDEKCTPTKGTEFSACVDLYAREDVVIGAGETVLVPLGVKIDLEKLKEDLPMCRWAKMRKVEKKNLQKILNQEVESFMRSHQLNLHIRSSMSAKHGLVIANGTGIIDLDYPGEIMICLHNPIASASRITQEITAGLIQIEPILNGAGSLIQGKVKIKKGDKIAQIGLVEHKTYLLGVESEEKRTGGFGSTNA